jgi:hypothetical protein
VSIVNFEDLQELSGYKQANKVIEWLREHRIRFIISGDGKPRTVDDFLREDLGDQETSKATPIRFG